MPLIYLDFVDLITGENILQKLYKFEYPGDPMPLFNPTDTKFLALRQKVDEKFLPVIFLIFDRLGEIPPEQSALFQDNTRMQIQSLTFNSLKQNLPRVFGIKNDLFAELLYLYLSDRKPLNQRINFMQFTERLLPFWPPPPDPVYRTHNMVKIEEHRQRLAKQKRKDVNYICF